ncbi:MAG: BNR-4 repeat-containing protein, partial [Candidatus Hydrogenedentes bacterium]|nr:BNR-4 repeat-containing protein [Candidatus Hydrogenedentota bacterium]
MASALAVLMGGAASYGAETGAAEATAGTKQGTAAQEEGPPILRGHMDGYRGIWFTLGQMSGEYGDKYSGGFAFCCNHTLIPMAIYVPEVKKTFFVYGGTTGPDKRHLLAMASYYDHERHRVPRPTIVRDQRGIDDPHDNPSIAIDESGYIWVFLAGRARHRPGQIFRATEPYSVEAFEQIAEREQTYSQIWPVPGKGFLHLMTKYTAGRELYWETSADGRTWSEQRKLAAFGGHYQISRLHGSKVGTAFNYHPGGNVDRRTNIYYAETTDFGETWTTVGGRPLETPLSDKRNPALVIDYEAQGQNAYIQKLVFDEDGRPVILCIDSPGYEPGPQNDPRTWRVTRWTGSEWVTHPITQSDHNYDSGSLYIDGSRWALFAPALPGPQPYYKGGEVGLWVSNDRGEHWELERAVTRNSPQNHSYVRRPHNPVDPFYAMWADGDSSQFSPSRLFFTNSTGDEVYML